VPNGSGERQIFLVCCGVEVSAGFLGAHSKHPHRAPMSLKKDPRWKRESSISNNKAAVGFRRRFSFPARTYTYKQRPNYRRTNASSCCIWRFQPRCCAFLSRRVSVCYDNALWATEAAISYDLQLDA
jgi:hypothetical protein